MDVEIYITSAFTTASLVLSIVALAVVLKFKDDLFSLKSKLAKTDRKSALANNRIDDVERKLARTVGWIEGLTGKTIKGVDVA